MGKAKELMNKKQEEDKLEHPCFPQPNDTEVKVWRYMDTSKFIDIILSKNLFFSRLDLLGDAYEGSIPKRNYKIRELEFKKLNMYEQVPSMTEGNKLINNIFFVNCWYCDNHESEAMWKLYCPDNKGIAIQTTYKKLVDSVSYDDQLFIGLIKYIDYETEWFPAENIFYPVMHKRKAFQYEKEIRLVKFDSKCYGKPISGIYCKWDITNVVENVYVNPYAQSWYYKIIKDILEKYNHKIKIEWSSIKGIPYY